MTVTNGGDGYEVLAVRYGTRQTRKSEIYLHYDLYNEPDGPAQMDYFFWVARSPSRVVLIDCGFNERSGGKRGRSMLCPPATSLHRLGIEPADVSQLILSHGHYDHIGNLDLFPSAEIVMSAREYDFWTGPLGTRTIFATSSEAEDVEALRRAAAAGRIRFVGGAGTSGEPPTAKVADGIEVIEVGGHTPGQLLTLVTAGPGQAILASDAVHYYDEVRLDRIFFHTTDLPGMYTCLELIRELTADGTRQFVAGHDPEVMEKFPALPDAAARDLEGLVVQIAPASAGDS